MADPSDVVGAVFAPFLFGATLNAERSPVLTPTRVLFGMSPGAVSPRALSCHGRMAVRCVRDGNLYRRYAGMWFHIGSFVVYLIFICYYDTMWKGFMQYGLYSVGNYV